MEKGPCTEPGFPCLPAALVNRCDQDHRESPHALKDPQSPHAASVSMMVLAIRMGTGLIKPLRHLCKARLYFQEPDWCILRVVDSIIIATLLLSAATATLTAPRSAAEAYQKLQALLLLQGTPEWIASAGAIGRRVPVWP